MNDIQSRHEKDFEKKKSEKKSLEFIFQIGILKQLQADGWITEKQMEHAIKELGVSL